MSKSDLGLSQEPFPPTFLSLLWMAGFVSLIHAIPIRVSDSLWVNESSLELVYSKITRPHGVSAGDHQMMFNAAISMDHASQGNLFPMFALIVALAALGLTVRDVVIAGGSIRSVLPFILAVVILLGTGATTVMLTGRAGDLAAQYLRSIDDQNSRDTKAAVAAMRDIWPFARAALFLQPLLIFGVSYWTQRRVRTGRAAPFQPA